MDRPTKIGSMSSDYDATEFVDGDLQAHKSSPVAAALGASSLQRAPSPEEVNSRMVEAQQALAAKKRELEERERQLAALQETRRRQAELQTGRQEMLQNLTRGLGLLEEEEFTLRRDAEQMAKALVDLKDALTKVQAIHEEAWTKESFDTELTRALTTLENARMEWNAARLKFPLLSNQGANGAATPGEAPAAPVLGNYSFSELCRFGFALTWPLAAVALIVMALLLALLLRH
jgi:hypothetical protein